MPLVLSLKPGDDFWVRQTQVVVADIENANRFWVRVAGNPKPVEITDSEATEVVPDVFVSSGGFYKYGMVRLAIEAPQEIEILRGDRYRKKYGLEPVQ